LSPPPPRTSRRQASGTSTLSTRSWNRTAWGRRWPGTIRTSLPRPAKRGWKRSPPGGARLRHPVLRLPRFPPRHHADSVAGGRDERAGPVDGRELVTRLNEWRSQPYVIVLASCQSAGKARDEETRLDEFVALAALGPRLAEAGVPACWPCRAMSVWTRSPN